MSLRSQAHLFQVPSQTAVSHRTCEACFHLYQGTPHFLLVIIGQKVLCLHQTWDVGLERGSANHFFLPKFLLKDRQICRTKGFRPLERGFGALPERGPPHFL